MEERLLNFINAIRALKKANDYGVVLTRAPWSVRLIYNPLGEYNFILIHDKNNILPEAFVDEEHLLDFVKETNMDELWDNAVFVHNHYYPCYYSYNDEAKIRQG